MSTALTTADRILTLLRRGFTEHEIAAILDADPAEINTFLLHQDQVPTVDLGG
jgi:hypothetical protein